MLISQLPSDSLLSKFTRAALRLDKRHLGRVRLRFGRGPARLPSMICLRLSYLL